MKVCTCFLLFGIFVYTNSTIVDTPKNNDIGVNPAHANVSESSTVEYSGDTKNFSNVDSSIRREITAIDQNKTLKPVFKAARLETVTDFILEAVNIINTYKDTTFKVFFRILDNEIRSYHYRDCKFSELMQNPDTRSWLAGTLKIIKGKSVSFMKANINKMVDAMTYKTYDVTELLDYINSLYRDTEQKFHRVLKELKDYKKTKSVRTHKQMIKGGVRYILFDHYTELDSNTRRELKERIEKFWNRFKNNNASNAQVNNSHEMNAVSESFFDSDKVSQNIIHIVKEVLNRDLKNKTERSISIYDEDIKQKKSGNYTEDALKVKLRSSKDDNKHKHHGKPDNSKPKSKHAKPNIFAEYNAVIDVQLANTELLKSLGVFKPVPDKKHGTTSDQRHVTQTKRDRFDLHTRPATKPSGLRTGPETKPKKPSLRNSKSLETINKYLNPLSALRSHIMNLFSKESKVVIQLMSDNYISKDQETTTQRPRTSKRPRPRTRQRSLKKRHQRNPPEYD